VRLCYCYSCQTLSRIDDYLGAYTPDGEPVNDYQLEDWVARHMHGFTEDTHPGGRIFPFDGRDIEIEGGRLDGVRVHVANEVDEVRAELAKVGLEVLELRDELKEDAMSCFRKHRRPTYPDRTCADYQADSKWLGKREKVEGQVFKVRSAYLCAMCPYETAVSIARRGYS